MITEFLSTHWPNDNNVDLGSPRRPIVQTLPHLLGVLGIQTELT